MYGGQKGGRGVTDIPRHSEHFRRFCTRDVAAGFTIYRRIVCRARINQSPMYHCANLKPRATERKAQSSILCRRLQSRHDHPGGFHELLNSKAGQLCYTEWIDRTSPQASRPLPRSGTQEGAYESGKVKAAAHRREGSKSRSHSEPPAETPESRDQIIGCLKKEKITSVSLVVKGDREASQNAGCSRLRAETHQRLYNSQFIITT